MMGKRDHHHRSKNVTITLEQLIPQNHLVRKIDAVIDVDFIYSTVENLYSENTERPSVDPVLLIKMALLQYVFGIPSMQRTIKEIETNVAYRWFLGPALDEKVPHFSKSGKNTFGVFRIQTSLRVFFIGSSRKESKPDSRTYRSSSLTPPTSKQTRTSGSIRRSSFDAPHNSTKKN